MPPKEPQESISRSAMLAVASNYTSVAKALMELIDNPIDYRGNRHLGIDVIVDKDDDRVIVRDVGGEGMNRDSLSDWLRWGEGHDHDAADIGQYHLGGKLACIFLARSLQINCRRAEEPEVWHFEDPEWGTRKDIVTPRITRRHVSDVSSAGQLRIPDDGMGFTQFTLSGLKKRRYNISVLKVNIAETYQTLLRKGVLTINVRSENESESISAPDIPWLSGTEPHEIPSTEVAEDVIISGRIGGIDRNRLRAKTKTHSYMGIRTDFNGRTITYGESFGHHLAGRGPSQRLYGEISITGSGLVPTQNKEGWDTDSPGWRGIHTLMEPLIRETIKELEGTSSDKQSQTSRGARSSQPKPAQPNTPSKPTKPKERRGATGRTGSLPSKSSSSKLIRWFTGDELITQAQARVEASLTSLHKEDTVRTPESQSLIDQLAGTRLPPITLKRLGSQQPRYQWVANESGKQELQLNSEHPLLRDAEHQDAILLETIVTAISLNIAGHSMPNTLISVLDDLHWTNDNSR